MDCDFCTSPRFLTIRQSQKFPDLLVSGSESLAERYGDQIEVGQECVRSVDLEEDPEHRNNHPAEEMEVGQFQSKFDQCKIILNSSIIMGKYYYQNSTTYQRIKENST